MKTIIAGSRDYPEELVKEFMNDWEDHNITEVVCGGARGPDTWGEVWAVKEKIPVTRFIPDWDYFGRSAGMVRNSDMALYADALIAFWDGESKGTKHMISEAKMGGLHVTVVGPSGIITGVNSFSRTTL